jgi:hypothetical protein
MKKVYVCSGELRWVGMAEGPLDACKRALKGFGGTLDSSYFFIDERGYRDLATASHKVPVSKALKAAGYVYEDPNETE